jgi:hypothetical protein
MAVCNVCQTRIVGQDVWKCQRKIPFGFYLTYGYSMFDTENLPASEVLGWRIILRFWG